MFFIRFLEQKSVMILILAINYNFYNVLDKTQRQINKEEHTGVYNVTARISTNE